MSECTIHLEDPSFSHEEFRTGLPFGRFRVVMNPVRAQEYLKERLVVIFIALPLLILGLAFGVYGSPWIGLSLILAGFFSNRLLRVNAPRIIVFLAARHPEIYRDAIQYEIMEVRLAR